MKRTTLATSSGFNSLLKHCLLNTNFLYSGVSISFNCLSVETDLNIYREFNLKI